VYLARLTNKRDLVVKKVFDHISYTINEKDLVPIEIDLTVDVR